MDGHALLQVLLCSSENALNHMTSRSDITPDTVTAHKLDSIAPCLMLKGPHPGEGWGTSTETYPGEDAACLDAVEVQKLLH